MTSSRLSDSMLLARSPPPHVGLRWCPAPCGDGIREFTLVMRTMHLLTPLAIVICLATPVSGTAQVPTGLCGMCKASVSNHAAGTNGSGTVVIEIQATSSEKGQCKPKNDECKQTRGCKLNFKIFTPAGSTQFRIFTAEVDPGINSEDLDQTDWDPDPIDQTGTYGYKNGLFKSSSCGKQLHIEALAGGASATATLECGECSEDELPH